MQIFVHQVNNTTIPEKGEKRCLTYDSCDIHQDVKKIKVEEEEIDMYGHGDNSMFCSVDQMNNRRVSGKGVKRCLTCDTWDTNLNVKKIRVETEHMDTNGPGGNSGFGSASIVGSQPTLTKNADCVCTCCHTKNLERCDCVIFVSHNYNMYIPDVARALSHQYRESRNMEFIGKQCHVMLKGGDQIKNTPKRQLSIPDNKDVHNLSVTQDPCLSNKCVCTCCHRQDIN